MAQPIGARAVTGYMMAPLPVAVHPIQMNLPQASRLSNAKPELKNSAPVSYCRPDCS